MRVLYELRHLTHRDAAWIDCRRRATPVDVVHRGWRPPLTRQSKGRRGGAERIDTSTTRHTAHTAEALSTTMRGSGALRAPSTASTAGRRAPLPPRCSLRDSGRAGRARPANPGGDTRQLARRRNLMCRYASPSIRLAIPLHIPIVARIVEEGPSARRWRWDPEFRGLRRLMRVLRWWVNGAQGRTAGWAVFGRGQGAAASASDSHARAGHPAAGGHPAALGRVGGAHPQRGGEARPRGTGRPPLSRPRGRECGEAAHCAQRLGRHVAAVAEVTAW